MKKLRIPATLGVFGVMVLMGFAALLHPQRAAADSPFNGASFLTTVKDSSGNFASRGVITLHTDHTLSVLDSGQGGPSFLFSSQLGSWKSDNKGGVTARTIDFDFPSSGVARLDYSISFDSSGNATGTITLTDFPLQGNPLWRRRNRGGHVYLCRSIDSTLEADGKRIRQAAARSTD